MKNIKLILVLVIALLLFNVSEADAALSKSWTGRNTGLSITGGWYGFDGGFSNPKYVDQATGELVYCVDAGAPDNNSGSVRQTSELTDEGLLVILENGQRMGNQTHSSGLTGDDFYLATLIALRAYNSIGGIGSNDQGYDPASMAAYANLARVWTGGASDGGNQFVGSSPLLTVAQELFMKAYNGEGSSISGVIFGSSGNGQRYIMPGDLNIPDVPTDVKKTPCPTPFSMPADCLETDEGYQTSVIPGPTDIENCVIENADWAGNAFQNECTSASTEYCEVYCMEDYTDIRFSGPQQVNSGRYFRVDARIVGTKSCYAKVDVAQFEADIRNLSSAVTNAKQAYDNAVNSIGGAQSRANNSRLTEAERQAAQGQYDSYKNIIDTTEATLASLNNQITTKEENINSCSLWDVSFETVPEIEYSYDEAYDDNLSSKDSKMVATPSITGTSTTLNCAGSVNNEYTSCSQLAIDNKKMNYQFCELTGCRTETVTYSDARYVAKTKGKTVDYTTPEIFHNAFPSGSIIQGEGTDETQLVEGLPVALQTETGLHQFDFKVNDLGEYNDAARCNTPGRIVDSESPSGTVGEKAGADLDYVCHYEVNPPTPTPPPEEPCPDCDVDVDINIPRCPNCLFEFGKIQLHFRTISTNSLSSFNPNDRPLGYNYNYNYNVKDIKYGFITGKAQNTLGSETSNTGILGIGDTFGQDPILTVTMTPSVANDIRSYNDQMEKDKKGYSNDTLVCEDYTSASGDVYKNIFCKSEMLNEWSSSHPDEFNFTEDREHINKYWTVYDDGLPPTGSLEKIGGPSWK